MYRLFAVFIDGDNISWKEYEAVLTMVRRYGEIAEVRVYGDWTQPCMNGWKEILEKKPALIYQAFRGKDAADYRIIIDAVEMAVQNTPVNAFCIASSDAGYRYLAYHVRARGKYTLGIGRRQASAEWRESCNNFRFLENPRCADGMETEAEAERETEAETDEEDAYGGAGTGETVSEGILGYGFNCCGKADRDGWILLSDFCNTIRDRRPLFSWKRYGEKPIDALERFAAAHPGVIELDKSRVDAYRIRRNPPYPSGRTALSCRPAIPCETVIGEGTGSIQKIADTYGFIENSEGIFYFKTEDAIPTESDPPKMAEGDTVSFKITKMPDAEKKIPEERNGKAVAVKTPPPQPPQPPAVSAWPPVVSK